MCLRETIKGLRGLKKHQRSRRVKLSNDDLMSYEVEQNNMGVKLSDNTLAGSSSLRSGILLTKLEEHYNLANLLFRAHINCADMKRI